MIYKNLLLAKNLYITLFFALVILIMSMIFVPAAHAVDNDNDEEIAKEMATLFRAARTVISEYQGLINDSEVGYKGVDADFVIKQTKMNYKKATGRDLTIDLGTRKGRFLQAELDAIRVVMDKNQDLINEKGRGFKGFLPAVFAANVADKTSDILSGQAEIKLTAPREYVRNRKNRPDKWEANVIENMFKSPTHPKDKPFSEVTEKKGKKVFRFILPEYYKEGCLTCHGDPKGERDITGGKKEGGKLGELGGAISIIIYK